MDIKRINELKKVQEKQDTIESMLYSLQTSSKQIYLRVEFENTDMEFYPTDRDGYTMEPCKKGLIIYLEHEIKHCELIKAEIVKEFALEMLPKLDTPETMAIETKVEEAVKVIKEDVSEDNIIQLKRVMESGENRFMALD